MRRYPPNMWMWRGMGRSIMWHASLQVSNFLALVFVERLEEDVFSWGTWRSFVEFYRMHVGGSLDVWWVFMGVVIVVCCVCWRFIRRSIGTSLRIIEGSFRVGWFVLVFVYGVLRGSLRIGWCLVKSFGWFVVDWRFLAGFVESLLRFYNWPCKCRVHKGLLGVYIKFIQEFVEG